MPDGNTSLMQRDCAALNFSGSACHTRGAGDFAVQPATSSTSAKARFTTTSIALGAVGRPQSVALTPRRRPEVASRA
jgi:hypothetical protein